MKSFAVYTVVGIILGIFGLVWWQTAGAVFTILVAEKLLGAWEQA